jgi:MoaA/NifB/PqqE/SkfB family radical SAM enzyme
MMGGYVLPCCAVLMSNQREFLRMHSFGNVFEKPFREIWYSERYKRFRQTVNNPKAKVPLFCKGCRAFDTSVRERKYGVDFSL